MEHPAAGCNSNRGADVGRTAAARGYMRAEVVRGEDHVKVMPVRNGEGGAAGRRGGVSREQTKSREGGRFSRAESILGAVDHRTAQRPNARGTGRGGAKLRHVSCGMLCVPGRAQWRSSQCGLAAMYCTCSAADDDKLASLPKDRRPPACALPLDRALVSVGRGWDAHLALPPRPADRRPKAHVDGGTPASGLNNS